MRNWKERGENELLNVVIVGVRVPGVLVATVTGVGAVTSPGVPGVDGLTSLPLPTEKLRGETEGIVLDQAVLREKFGTEFSVAVGATGGND